MTDGATWIGQWIAQRYEEAVHIIDFFMFVKNWRRWLLKKMEGGWPDKRGAAP